MGALSSIPLPPRRAAWLLAGAILMLSAMGFAVTYSKFILDHGYLRGLVPMFDLNEERNVPTWYASTTLLICSFLFGAIAYRSAHARRAFAGHWTWLAVIFAYMSLEEVACIHEQISLLLGREITHIGIFHFAWVIPASILLVIFAVVFFRFWMGLPKKIRQGLSVAGLVYTSGALGMELVVGNYASAHGMTDFTYASLSNFEEVIEMIGIAILIPTLLSHLYDLPPSDR